MRKAVDSEGQWIVDSDRTVDSGETVNSDRTVDSGETVNSEKPGCSLSTIHYPLITEAESWIGTPWMHGQAVKGAGTDCVQFLVKLGKFAGAISEAYEPPRYNRDWALHNNRSILREEIAKFCEEVIVTSYELRVTSLEPGTRNPEPGTSPALCAGDIILTVQGKTASHAAIYIGDELVIEARIRGGVVKARLDSMGQIDSVWRFKK